jgi:hypothetical protein
MGMFDYVKIDKVHGLPDIEYQSKDFDCDMTTIRITENGRLEIERGDYETVPKEERPYPNDEGILGMMGSIRKVNRRWDDLNLHGMFNFYGNSGPNFDGEWFEYNAKFTDGALVRIERDETP